MVEIDVFVSSGSEVSHLRDIAHQALGTIEESFVYGMNVSVVIRNWDYRHEPPEVVGKGELAARSLKMVDEASAVIGILGPSIPPITAEELIRAVQRFAKGDADNVWVFLDHAYKGQQHRRFLRRIRREAEMEVVYQEFNDELEFQRMVFRALYPYVAQLALPQSPIRPIGGPAA